MMNELVKEDIFNLFANGLDPEEIADSMCITLEEVKACIVQNKNELVARDTSPEMVNAMVKQGRCLVSDEEHSVAIKQLVEIAKFSDNDSARLKAIQIIHDEKTGRAEERHLAELVRATRGVGAGDSFIDIEDKLAKAKKIKERAMAGRVIEATIVNEEDV